MAITIKPQKTQETPVKIITMTKFTVPTKEEVKSTP